MLMKTAQNDIINQGSHHIINATISLLAMTGLACTYVIAASSTSSALVTKTVGSGLTITDSTHVAIAFVPTDTAALAGTYWHELRVTNGSGQTDLLFTGTLTITPNVTG